MRTTLMTHQRDENPHDKDQPSSKTTSLCVKSHPLYLQVNELLNHPYFKTTLFTKQREIMPLNRQGTQQQRPDSPTLQPGTVVNTRYVNSIKGTSSKTTSV